MIGNGRKNKQYPHDALYAELSDQTIGDISAITYNNKQDAFENKEYF